MDRFIKSGLRLIIALVIFFGLPIASDAELWPTFEDYVGRCVLIVKARTVVEKDGFLTFEVEESWKGEYDPEMFMNTTPEGRFFARKGEHGVNDVVDGQEIIFFFTPDNQPVEGKLSRHSTAFPVREGKVVYASTSDELSQEYTLEEFKEAILDLVTARTKDVKSSKAQERLFPHRLIPESIPTEN